MMTNLKDFGRFVIWNRGCFVGHQGASAFDLQSARQFDSEKAAREHCDLHLAGAPINVMPVNSAQRFLKNWVMDLRKREIALGIFRADLRSTVLMERAILTELYRQVAQVETKTTGDILNFVGDLPNVGLYLTDTNVTRDRLESLQGSIYSHVETYFDALKTILRRYQEEALADGPPVELAQAPADNQEG